MLSELPSDANVFCVGAGTGVEILSLAQKISGWYFSAVEPSAAMMDVSRASAEARGISSRCAFHCGYLESLQTNVSFDAATAFLVSQFIQSRENRSEFFHGIADRLRPAGVLISSELAGVLQESDFQSLLEVWLRLTSANESTPDATESLRKGYSRDVAVIPPGDVRDIISTGGFDTPVQPYRAGLFHVWYARRSSGE